jgi:hypothetical protein
MLSGSFERYADVEGDIPLLRLAVMVLNLILRSSCNA